MTREQAIKRIKRVLGAAAYWRISDGVSSPEKRARYEARRRASREAREAAGKALDARRRELLNADAQYQQLLAAYNEARAAAEDVRYHDGESGYKFEVGTRAGIFTQPKAHGDTWEEVFAQLEEKQQRRAAGGAQ